MRTLAANRFITILHFLSLLLVVTLPFFVACSGEEPGKRSAKAPAGEVNQPDDTVARVGDEVITYSLLNTMLNSSTMVGMSIPELGTPERNQAMIALLDNAISANLVFLDAKKKGVDRLSAYKEDVSRFEASLLASMYKNMLMQGDIQVGEIDVLHHYNTQSSMEIELNDDTQLAIEAMLRKKKLDEFEATLRDRIRKNVDVTINEKVLSAEYDNKRSDADVVASYDKHRVTWSQVKELMQNANRNPTQSDFYINDYKERKTRLEQHLDNVIMALKGSAAGLEDDPDFIKRTAEYRKARLINEHRNGLIHSWNPGDVELKTYFDNNKDMFTVPEARRVQMVSVKTREEADSILDKINKNEITIEQAAMQYSIDPQAKQTQGHLGWISQGTILESLEDSIFKLEPDTVSEPVQSTAGWHLIKVLAIDEAQVENLDKPQVRQRAFRAYMQDKFNDYVVDLRKNHFEVVVYQDELERQFKREADFIAGLDAQEKQEAITTEQRIEELQKYITPSAQQ